MLKNLNPTNTELQRFEQSEPLEYVFHKNVKSRASSSIKLFQARPPYSSLKSKYLSLDLSLVFKHHLASRPKKEEKFELEV